MVRGFYVENKNLLRHTRKIPGTQSLFKRKGLCPEFPPVRGLGGLGRLSRYMLMEMLRPPLPNRGLTTLLRVDPKEKFRPIENE